MKRSTMNRVSKEVRKKLATPKFKTRERYVRLLCRGMCADISGTLHVERFLTVRQYDAQMKDPNRGWRCPSCGEYPCGFDDKYYELPLAKETK